MTVMDHFLSQEEFELLKCASCGLIKTHPCPSPEHLPDYYKSEEYLSHGADKKGLFASLYRLAKSFNIGNKVGLFRSLIPAGHILDFGCGTGDLISHAKASGYTVRGAEPSQAAISHAPADVMDLIVSPDQELTSPRQYDIISMFHVLEHVEDPKTLVTSLRNKLNPKGYLIIAVPNFTSFDAEHYGADWAAWDVPRHLWHYSPDQMIPFIEQIGFHHTDAQPMWFDAFYVALLSERYRSGSSLMGLFWAALSNLKALTNKKRVCSSQVYVFRAK
jgi:SAM-dependent methyltransferase